MPTFLAFGEEKFDDRMGVNKSDIEAVRKLLVPGEIVAITATQRRVGPGGSVLTPTTVVCTNMRIIILNRASMGLRNDYETIPYKQITSARFESGIINGSVFIRVEGYDRDKGLLAGGREEGEIDGLRLRDAKLITDYVSRMIIGYAGTDVPPQPRVQPPPDAAPPDTGDAVGVYCSHCGARNKLGSSFCTSCGAKIGR